LVDKEYADFILSKYTNFKFNLIKQEEFIHNLEIKVNFIPFRSLYIYKDKLL